MQIGVRTGAPCHPGGGGLCSGVVGGGGGGVKLSVLSNESRMKRMAHASFGPGARKMRLIASGRRF